MIHKVSQRDKNHKTLDPKAAAQELDRRIDHNRTSDSNAAQALGRQNIDDKAPGQEFSLCQSCSRILSAAIESLMVILYLKVMLSTRMPEHSYVIQTFAGYASR